MTSHEMSSLLEVVLWAIRLGVMLLPVREVRVLLSATEQPLPPTARFIGYPLAPFMH